MVNPSPLGITSLLTFSNTGPSGHRSVRRQSLDTTLKTVLKIGRPRQRNRPFTPLARFLMERLREVETVR